MIKKKKIYFNSTDEIEILKKNLLESHDGTKSFRYFNKRNFGVLKNHLCTFLFFNDENCIGYGHLDRENDEIWLGVIVFDGFNGKGYGNFILENLIKEYNGTIFLTVDKSNYKAINLYKKNGFSILEEDINIYKMILKR